VTLIPEVTTQERILDRLKAAVSVSVGPQMAQSMELETYSEYVLNQLVHRLTAFVLAERVDTKPYTAIEHVYFPESPWQHFKQKHQLLWWMKWFVKRRPVDYQKVDVTVSVTADLYATYPRASYSHAPYDQFGPVVWQQMTRRIDE